MSSPSFFGDGSTPRITDTRWAILQKILGATIDGGSGGSALLSGAGSPQGSVTGSVGQRYRDTVSGSFWTNIDGGTGWAVE